MNVRMKQGVAVLLVTLVSCLARAQERDLLMELSTEPGWMRTDCFKQSTALQSDVAVLDTSKDQAFIDRTLNRLAEAGESLPLAQCLNLVRTSSNPAQARKDCYARDRISKAALQRCAAQMKAPAPIEPSEPVSEPAAPSVPPEIWADRRYATRNIAAADLLLSQAQTLAEQGKTAEAIEKLERAMIVFENFDPVNETSFEARELLGRLYLKQHRLNDALAVFQRSFDHYRQWQATGPLKYEPAVKAANELNQYYYDAQDYPQAERWGQQALDGDPSDVTLASNLIMAQLAQPSRVGAGLTLATTTLAEVDERASHLLDTPQYDISRARLEFDRLQAIYLFLDAAWFAGRADPAANASLRIEAFRRLQEVTGGPAAQSIAQSAAHRYAADAGSANLVRQRDELQEKWHATVAQYQEVYAKVPQEDENTRAEVRNRFDVGGLNKQIEALNAQIEARAPQYFAIVRQPALSLADAQALLREDESVVLLVPTVLGTHAIAVSKAGLQWNFAPLKRVQINDMVDRLRQDLDPTARNVGVGLPSFDRQTAHALYEALIAPLSDSIGKTTHLFVSAPGALASLPFGVLVTQAPAAGEDNSDPYVLKTTHWFADDHALVQLPSLQSLAFIRRYGQRGASSGRRERFAGYGDPALNGPAESREASGQFVSTLDAGKLVGGTTDTRTALMNPDELRKLPTLPGTGVELKALNDTFHGTIHLGSEMTEHGIKSDARSGKLARTDVLDIATHGLTVGESGGLAEPGLVFTPPAKATAEDDGYLSAAEIVGLDFNGTNWVILSACNSAGASRETPGSSLSGLASAFLYAGATDLLVSHWPVYDEVAAQLTFDTLSLAGQPGTSKAQALQAAMRKLRSKYPHPRAWAPLVLVGDR